MSSESSESNSESDNEAFVSSRKDVVMKPQENTSRNNSRNNNDSVIDALRKPLMKVIITLLDYIIMAKLLVIKITKTGKKYFVVNGRKVCVQSKMTKRVQLLRVIILQTVV